MVSPFPEGRDLGMGIRYKELCVREKFRSFSDVYMIVLNVSAKLE